MSYSSATTPRTSVELAKEAIVSSSSSISSSSTSATSKAHGIWSSIKRHAKEHHQATNAAYATYYGQGQTRPGQEIWQYKRN
ncbi:hypothetical protein CC86DRAFT_103319 [Ophiobolus disseminans]|uniref:Uncharacterized protein n=1 Tax=Ophiobolus disseminans TaxID=1469910 RepID=A0A6A6ZMC4_9PLEO|nr:hypothetical protein CC86DRAFT_103319 [Ophiobolus disseminans]